MTTQSAIHRALTAVAGLALAAPATAGIYFEDVTDVAGIDAPHVSKPPTCGQAVGDVDRDGWPDLFVTGFQADNRLYINDGDGTFSGSPHSATLTPAGADCGSAAFADYDNDGWPDLYLACFGDNYLFRNLQGAGFTDVTTQAAVNHPNRSEVVAWGDVNADGWLDLYIGTHPGTGDPEITEPENWDWLLLNNGDGSFSDATAALAGADAEPLTRPVLAAQFSDLDADGDADLYVVNDRLRGNMLWRNDGPGCGGWCFSDVSQATGTDAAVWGMGIAIGDTDRDGDPDMYFSSIGEQIYLENRLAPTGALEFIDRSAELGLDFDATGWATHFMDADNDGWLDAYLATAGLTPADADRFYRHDPAGSVFEDISAASGISDTERTIGASQWDYDRDGRVDLVTCNANRAYRLFRNVSTDTGHWVGIELIGSGPVNRDAVGAVITLRAGAAPEQRREVAAGQARGGNSMLAQHFGTGEATAVDVKVTWPDGTEQTVNGLGVDRYHAIGYAAGGLLMRCGFETQDQ